MTIEKAKMAETLLGLINLRKSEISGINAASLGVEESTTNVNVNGKTIFFPQQMLLDYIDKQLKLLEEELRNL